MADRQIIIIAGPNGAGKTTFAEAFLPTLFAVPLFVNADKIAGGLAPFTPEREAIQAGRLMLRQIDRYVAQQASFAFETTLAGRGYARKIPHWQAQGYIVSLVFLWLRDEETALERVAHRVTQGGHDVPAEVVRRRFRKGLQNFETVYRPIVDNWYFFDNMKKRPRLLKSGGR